MNSRMFVVLGSAGSGRVALLKDWIVEQSRVLVHVDEKSSALSAGIPPELLVPWKWQEERIAIGAEIPADSELFFLTHGLESPVDQLEGIQEWMQGKFITHGL